jgi:hypothetical protein
MQRKAADVVVVLFSAMVCLSVVIGTLTVIIAKIIHPQVDISRATEIIGNVLTTVVGALVGFVGGRATGKSEANGNSQIK